MGNNWVRVRNNGVHKLYVGISLTDNHKNYEKCHLYEELMNYTYNYTPTN